MAKISTISTEAPSTDTKLIGDIGSTTKQFSAQQVADVGFAASQDLRVGSGAKASTNLTVGSSGSLLHVSTAGAVAWLGAGTTGQYLAVKTSAGELGWTSERLGASTVGITSGAIAHISTAGVPAWLSVGTTGQVLQVGTSAGELGWSSAQLVPSTAGITSGALLHITTAGTKGWLAVGTTGQVLQVGTSAGELTWSTARLVPTTAAITSGAVLHISSANVPAWLAVGTTGQYLRVGTSAGELGWSSAQLVPTTVGTTDGSFLVHSSGNVKWRHLEGGNIWVGSETSAITTISHTNTTMGGKIVAQSSAKVGWIDDDWGLTAIIDGGGSQITTGIKGFVRFPWDAGIESMEFLVSTGNVTSASVGIDLYLEDFSSTPGSSASKITDSSYVKISSGAQRTSGINSSWTTFITAGDYITFDVVDASSGVTILTFSMWGRKLSTV